MHGEKTWTWSETAERCTRLAGALHALGIGDGDTVAVLAPNTPALLEAHFGVPIAGGVLNAINTLLDAPTVTQILEHGTPRCC